MLFLPSLDDLYEIKHIQLLNIANADTLYIQDKFHQILSRFVTSREPSSYIVKPN